MFEAEYMCKVARPTNAFLAWVRYYHACEEFDRTLTSLRDSEGSAVVKGPLEQASLSYALRRYTDLEKATVLIHPDIVKEARVRARKMSYQSLTEVLAGR